MKKRQRSDNILEHGNGFSKMLHHHRHPGWVAHKSYLLFLSPESMASNILSAVVSLFRVSQSKHAWRLNW